MLFIEKIKKHPEEAVLIFILLAGAVFRFHHLGITSLSNDELSALIRTRFNSFGELIEKGVSIDGHPAFTQVLLYYWIKVFGDGVFSIRFPFAVAGIVSIYMIYLVGKKWFSNRTGLFAAGALSTLQFPLLYSQLARPYVFSMLFTLMSVYFWTILLFENSTTPGKRNRALPVAAFVLSMSGCLYTHYFSFLEAIIIGISGLFFLRKDNWKEYMLSCVLIVLFYVPHLSIFFKQLAIGGVGLWLPKPDESFLVTFIQFCFNNSNFILFLCFAICITGFIFFRKRYHLNKYHWLSFAWFLSPFVIGYYYSIRINPVLQYSTLLVGFPFLLLLLFSFFPGNKPVKKIYLQQVILFTLIIGISTVKEKLYYWTNHFGVFKELAEDAIRWSDHYGESKITKVISVSNPEYINYYFEKMGRKMKIDSYKTDEAGDLARLMNLVDTTTSIYFLYGWSNVGQPFETRQIITNKFPLVTEHKTYFNSEITLFKRDSTITIQKSSSPFTDFENNHWGDELKVRNNETAHSGKYSQKLDDKTEYSISYSKPIVELSAPVKGLVTASVWFKTTDAKNAKLVCSFESAGISFDWHAADLQPFNLEPGQWQKVILSRPIPGMKTNRDVMKIYIWNEGKKTLYVDDFEVKVE